MASADYLTLEQLQRALTLRDLTDPLQGPHAIQALLVAVVNALAKQWGSSVRHIRATPIVAVRENYDRLGYDGRDITRDRRYTRYISPTVMLRSHTSAEIPTALEHYANRSNIDELIVVPGLVYRRDVVDRHHVGEPHQVDLWRIRDTAETGDHDLRDMIGRVAEAVLPGTNWRISDVVHPYTVGGHQVDVQLGGDWLELAECGLIHPDVLRGSGLDPHRWSGLALGMGLDRALMLRKGVDDIRYLRATDTRMATQMLTLERWKPVSALPAARRDISVVVGDDEDEETLGDRVRTGLAGDADMVESLDILSRTAHSQLPQAARQRLATIPGQSNLLIRIVLRPIESTLTSHQANDLRNRIYSAIHQGQVMELI